MNWTYGAAGARGGTRLVTDRGVGLDDRWTKVSRAYKSPGDAMNTNIRELKAGTGASTIYIFGVDAANNTEMNSSPDKVLVRYMHGGCSAGD